MRKKPNNLDRRKLLSSLLLGSVTVSLSESARAYDRPNKATPNVLNQNPLLWAVAWSATAAEYGALCHQAFNLAQLRVEKFLKRKDLVFLFRMIIIEIQTCFTNTNNFFILIDFINNIIAFNMLM